ncbi:MarR family winged helix-turn-helix transcriptional regulator [Saccharomonospora piscinae]|uniref:MarR family winged helix-turn-helix transcriptional regulator n=1 Tax=Saccharomonospora piscinae TaxID=687388 RepID=UPI000465A3C9|nr:MarR family transcriptional regulator [Saccharomonospora piscinae]
MTAEHPAPEAAVPQEPEPPLTLYLVKRLELVVRALLDDALRPHGLTTLQYTALSVLRRRGGLSSAQLARRSFLRPQTMHEMVVTLEQRGLISRERDPGNRRILLARLTDRGDTLLDTCEPLVLALEEHLLAPLDARQRDEFRATLGTGIDALSELHRELEHNGG